MLYILRPAIYAIAMRQLDDLPIWAEREEDESSAEGTVDGDTRPVAERLKATLKKYAVVLISLVYVLPFDAVYQHTSVQ